ncbi:MAG: hypothetical protein QXL94_03030 [Candidatus Parvarchaeum sp.]
MPSKAMYRDAWTEADREQASAAMKAHAAAERQCVTVVGDKVSYDKKCFRDAIPKGTNASLWH